MAAARLRCEELGERVVPALAYFAFDGGSGFFDYDDAGADAADPDQEVDMSDIGFTYGGSTYTGGDLVSGAIVKLEYGRPSGFVFEVVDVPTLAVQVSSGGYTVVTVDPHGTPSPTIPWPGTTIYGHGPVDPSTAGDVTGEDIEFTLSDGTLVTGRFLLNTDEIVSTGSVDLTDLTLTVGETTFTIEDFDSTPTADFSSGTFTGLSFSLTTVPNGTPFDSLVASGDGTVTATVDSVEQVKPINFRQEYETLTTLIVDDEYELTGTAGTVNVALTVTYNAPGYAGLYLWEYTVENPSANTHNLTSFDLPFDDTTDVDNVASSLGWTGTVASDDMSWAIGTGSTLAPGSSATFSFTTGITEVDEITAGVGSTGVSADGPVVAPAPRPVNPIPPRASLGFNGGLAVQSYQLTIQLATASGATSTLTLNINVGSAQSARDVVLDALAAAGWVVKPAGNDTIIILGVRKPDGSIDSINSGSITITNNSSMNAPNLTNISGVVIN